MPKFSIYLFKLGYGTAEPFIIMDDNSIVNNDFSIFNRNVYIDDNPIRIKAIIDNNYEPIKIYNSKSPEEVYYNYREKDDPWWRKFWDIKETFTLNSVDVIVIMNISGRLFASVHGNGRFLLNPIAIEYDFGLKTALNLVDDKKISTAGLFTPSEIAMRTLKQAGKDTGINQYDINIYNSLLKSISGKVKKEYSSYFRTIEGADTIHFSYSGLRSGLYTVIDELYLQYQKDTYKNTDLYWIDNFKIVRSKEIIAKLDNNLVDELKKENQNITLLFPEFISSSDYYVYSYSGINHLGSTDTFFSDLDIDEQIFKKIVDKEDINLNNIKLWQINRTDYSNAQNIRHYSIYQCIYYEYILDEKHYFLESGNWYVIEKEFIKTVEDNYQKMLKNQWEIDFNYSSVELDANARKNDVDNEYLFNVELTKYLNLFDIAECLDTKLIPYQKSKIELCDVLYKSNDSLFFIHNKYKHGSSSLSHLFSQGSVSAESIVDKKFREKANEKIDEPRLKLPLIDKIERNNIFVVYGIISKMNKKMEISIPIFSKINLMLFSKHIETLGYNIKLCFFRKT